MSKEKGEAKNGQCGNTKAKMEAFRRAKQVSKDEVSKHEVEVDTLSGAS